jgi:hypothetical protein
MPGMVGITQMSNDASTVTGVRLELSCWSAEQFRQRAPVAFTRSTPGGFSPTVLGSRSKNQGRNLEAPLALKRELGMWNLALLNNLKQP